MSRIHDYPETDPLEAVKGCAFLLLLLFSIPNYPAMFVMALVKRFLVKNLDRGQLWTFSLTITVVALMVSKRFLVDWREVLLLAFLFGLGTLLLTAFLVLYLRFGFKIRVPVKYFEWYFG